MLSCNQPKEMDVDIEQKRIIELLVRNGFISVPSPKGARESGTSFPYNIENKNFNSYEEAEAFVNELNSYVDSNMGNTVKRGVSGGRKSANPARLAFIACDDPGTYYVNRATYGLFSDVNIRYERDSFGNLTNISTNVTGVPLYVWAQQGVTIFNKHEFCIDVNVVFGVSFQNVSLPTAWSKTAKLRVWLDTDGTCNGLSQFGWGHC
jgi:hypothetical protein